MHFSRLRLSGFKSFVDPTELHIEPGLTGVVGPNGCGKSNLLEAIRWVMGENRVKSLRGVGMDDVIFAGTDKRPPRNMSEVTLVLDNLERNAPDGYNDHDMIEVTRRIERESGSAYRINGADVRAKDVQLLFADAATGAHSPALVSQGRIGALINAKPQDRRQVLEEAAGISGLHSRRKEAEQRLRGAETNLTRLQDVVVQMESQISSLNRQAKQAIRYRSISDDVRRAEASVLYIKWRECAEEVVQLEAKLRQAESAVAEITKIVAKLTTEQTDLALALPALRTADAECAAKLQRLTIERDNLNHEEQRRKDLAVELTARLAQIAEDLNREQEIARDSGTAVDRLNLEKTRLESARDSEKQLNIDAKETLETKSKAASGAEEDFDRMAQKTAAARARKESLESDVLAVERRVLILSSERERLARELDQLSGSDQSVKALAQAEKNVTTVETQLKTSSEAVIACEQANQISRQALGEVEASLNERRGTLKALSSEVQGLRTLLDTQDTSANQPLSKDLRAEVGFERAVGAALGDDVEANIDIKEARHWQLLNAYTKNPVWPEGVKPLSEIVKAPKALNRRIAYIGVIMNDEVDGSVLAKKLEAGMRLVNRAGSVWRWDGYVVREGAPSQAAIRLEQRNRLEELEAILEKAEKDAVYAEAAVVTAQETALNARESESASRTARSEAERQLATARRELVSAEQVVSQRATRANAIKEADGRLASEASEAGARLDKIQADISELPQSDKLEADLATLRMNVEHLRSELSQARAAYDSLRREAEARSDRLIALSTEQSAWQLRVTSAEKHIKALNERGTQTEQQIKALTSGPDNLEEKRTALLEYLVVAEKERAVTSDALAVAETSLAGKEKEMREAQTNQQELRENQIRLDAGVEAASTRRKDIAAQVGERFNCPPSHVLEKVGIESSDDLAALSVVENKLDQLKRERDRMGAVNLRAEEELKEIDEQLSHMVSERADLVEAIARLRGAINSLNKEGRERLFVAFTEVNQHFRELFRSLFGGGEAHLKLTESDDPLEAGLEIFASPPGKKMQSLSLLSGGEQALTATSLIFAVFITNPAPICVLDEVDAPLDDANVERFCDLLEEMLKKTNTRFLIVTHNAVTMARMNRLFGVTMSERGVSQLVSVDLEEAEVLRDAG
jgi:chromosome segregation protein